MAFESVGVMKTLLGITALSLGLSLLVGCASTQKTTYRDAPPPQTAGYTEADARYMSIVEGMARQRGIQVVWVNPPKKKAPTVAAVD